MRRFISVWDVSRQIDARGHADPGPASRVLSSLPAAGQPPDGGAGGGLVEVAEDHARAIRVARRHGGTDLGATDAAGREAETIAIREAAGA